MGTGVGGIVKTDREESIDRDTLCGDEWTMLVRQEDSVNILLLVMEHSESREGV